MCKSQTLSRNKFHGLFIDYAKLGYFFWLNSISSSSCLFLWARASCDCWTKKKRAQNWSRREAELIYFHYSGRSSLAWHKRENRRRVPSWRGEGSIGHDHMPLPTSSSRTQGLVSPASIQGSSRLTPSMAVLVTLEALSSCGLNVGQQPHALLGTVHVFDSSIFRARRSPFIIRSHQFDLGSLYLISRVMIWSRQIWCVGIHSWRVYRVLKLIVTWSFSSHLPCLSPFSVTSNCGLDETWRFFTGSSRSSHHPTSAEVLISTNICHGDLTSHGNARINKTSQPTRFITPSTHGLLQYREDMSTYGGLIVMVCSWRYVHDDVYGDDLSWVGSW